MCSWQKLENVLRDKTYLLVIAYIFVLYNTSQTRDDYLIAYRYFTGH